MGFPESDSRCRRHPNHRQSPGVCSACLREKLSKLSISPSFSMRKKQPNLVSHSSSLSSSSSPPYSSASSTTTTGTRKSPGGLHRRNGSEAYVSVGMMLNDGLKKSRSVSCAPLTRSKLGANANEMINEKLKSCVKGGGDQVEEGSLKKRNGFLKKLIHNTSKKTKGVLMHSKTMKERSHSSSVIATTTR